nr:SPOR domain-containing protein [Sphingomonas tagetis]
MRLKTRLIAGGVGIALCGAWSAQASAQAGASYAPPQAEGGPPPSEGPQGSSQRKPGEERYDRVGYAGYAGEGAGVFATSDLLPAGSHAEVTALDTGRTIIVAIRGGGSGLIDLSGAAAKQLGVTGNPAVRVRRVTASAQDAAQLAAGEPAPLRADAPQVLLVGLRRQLKDADTPKPQSAAVRRPARPAAATPVKQPKPAPAPASRATRGLFVQVAALSNVQRARALADQLGGVVRSAGNVHRVQTGPYPNAAAAQRARADAARRGYGDARVVSVP